MQIDSGAVVTGTGVTFVLTSSSGKSSSYPSVSINGSSSIHITAPTSNSALGTDSSGVVIFEDPKASGNLTINGTSTTYFGGAIVAPSMAINFSGTGVSGNGKNCTQIIGDTVTFIGNSTICFPCRCRRSWISPGVWLCSHDVRKLTWRKISLLAKQTLFGYSAMTPSTSRVNSITGLVP